MDAPTDAGIPRCCARCDYPLVGLPADGSACPECGAPADRRFVILRGHAVGPQATAATAGVARAAWLAIGGAGCAAFLFGQQILDGLRRDSILDVIGGAFWLGVFAFPWIPVLIARFGERGPPAQLWLCDVGFLIRGRRQPIAKSNAAPLPNDRLMSPLAWALAAIAGIAFAVCYAIGTVFALIPAVALVMIVATAYSIRAAARATPPRRSVRVPDLDGSLWFTTWTPTIRVDVEPVPPTPDRHEVRLESVGSAAEAIDRVRLTRFVAHLDARGAAELRRLLASWRATSSEPAAFVARGQP